MEMEEHFIWKEGCPQPGEEEKGKGAEAKGGYEDPVVGWEEHEWTAPEIAKTEQTIKAKKGDTEENEEKQKQPLN